LRLTPIASILTLIIACDAGPTAVVTPDAGAGSPDAVAADAGFEPDADPPADAGFAPDADPPPVDGGFDPTDTGVFVGDAGAVRRACDPPLGLMPRRRAALPLDLVELIGTGGTGNYDFAQTQNESGGILNTLNGAYLTGATAGVEDRFFLTDRACVGEAQASLTIVSPMQVQPLTVELAYAGTFDVAVSEGSGNYSFDFVANSARGTVDAAGRYTAAMRGGTDVLRVTDDDTLQTIEILVNVVEGSVLRPWAPHVLLALGERHALQMAGGSGHFRATGTSSAAVLVDGDLLGAFPGRTTLTVSDDFTGAVTSVVVDVRPAHTFTATRAGDYSWGQDILGPGDLNGDGFADAIVSNMEADVAAANGGAIYIYSGVQGGLSPTPVQILANDQREARMGRRLVLEDFDGDGTRDLVTGAYLYDDGQIDRGSVFIYRGVAGGFFEETPQRIGGQYSYDYFGYSLTSCDFDGDGLADLAVGAYGWEDRSASPRRFTQGGLHVFLGRPNGLRDEPDVSVPGQIPDGSGGMAGFSDLRLGVGDIAAGDIDGDGRCDLVGSTYFHRDGGGSRNGLIYVYRGVPGGVQVVPSLGFRSAQPGDRDSYLGRSLDVADVTGDGRADIIAGEFQHERAGQTNRDFGGFRIFVGRSLGDDVLSEIQSADTAELTWEGYDRDDESGWWVRAADVTGDGLLDVLSGNWRDEFGGPGDQGTITVFAGRMNGLPEPVPTATIAGIRGGDRFGTAFEAVGDLDGDGRSELIAYAGLADFHGMEVGRPYLVYSDPAQAYLPLEFPAQPSNDQYARALAIVGDVNDDGFDDLIAGAPDNDVVGRGVNSGRAFLYLGTATGFELDPALEITTFPGHTGGDRLGWAASRAGDFNGDGVDDFALVSRYDDRLGSFNANTYAPERACAGGRNNSGSVNVFLGASGALPSVRPSYVYFGPDANDTIRRVTGGFDHDGDGFDDIAVGALEWDRAGANNSGGVALIRGRAENPNRIIVICDPAWIMRGDRRDDYLGRGLATVGDLNGDGCDELAVGAPLVDSPGNQGAVRIVFGAGAASCPAAPEMTVIASGVANSASGFRVAGGGDVDGDQVPDIVVGAPSYRVGNIPTGAVWLVSGAYVAQLPREPLGTTPTQRHPFVDAMDGTPRLLIGNTQRAEYGGNVALVRRGNETLVAIGAWLESSGPVAQSGGTLVWRLDPVDGWQVVAGFGGETGRAGGRFGRSLAGGARDGRAVLVVGGPYASLIRIDSGAAVSFSLDP